MPKVIDHDKYRTELLSKCLDLFADKGFGNLTMRQLASELGVSTGTLYHYWKGKQDIFEDLVSFLNQKDQMIFLSSVGEPKSLKKKLEFLISYITEHEDYFLKQLFISIDYYRQQDTRAAIVHNEVLKKSNEDFRKGLSLFLGIKDNEVITFIMNVLSGAMLGRMYEGELISFERQGKMMSKMLKFYLNEG